MQARHHGTFEDISVLDEFVPVGMNGGRRVVGYLDNSQIYGGTCAYLAVEINFATKGVELFFVEDLDKDISEYTPRELINGDGLINLQYTDEAWERVIALVGTFDAIEDKLRQHPVATNIMNGGKRRRGRRSTRKMKRKQRRYTRK